MKQYFYYIFFLQFNFFIVSSFAMEYAKKEESEGQLKKLIVTDRNKSKILNDYLKTLVVIKNVAESGQKIKNFGNFKRLCEQINCCQKKLQKIIEESLKQKKYFQSNEQLKIFSSYLNCAKQCVQKYKKKQNGDTVQEKTIKKILLRLQKKKELFSKQYGDIEKKIPINEHYKAIKFLWCKEQKNNEHEKLFKVLQLYKKKLLFSTKKKCENKTLENYLQEKNSFVSLKQLSFDEQLFLWDELRKNEQNQNDILYHNPTQLIVGRGHKSMRSGDADINRYRFGLKLAMIVLEKLKKGILQTDELNPGVGDNACQMYAQKTLELFNDSSMQVLKKRAAQKLRKIKIVQQVLQKNIIVLKKYKKKEIRPSVVQWFTAKNCLFNLCRDDALLFLIRSYLLTPDNRKDLEFVAAQCGNGSYNNESKKIDFGIVDVVKKEMACSMRQYLRKKSVDILQEGPRGVFLQTLWPSIKELPKGLILIAGEKNKKSCSNFMAVLTMMADYFQKPCYPIRISCLNICDDQKKGEIHAGRFDFFCAPDKKGEKLSVLSLLDEKKILQTCNRNYLSMEGIRYKGSFYELYKKLFTDFYNEKKHALFIAKLKKIKSCCKKNENCFACKKAQQDLESQDILPILWENEAMHPQFPGGSKAKINFDAMPNLKKFYKKNKTRKLGSCRDDMSTLFIYHIRPCCLP